MSIANPHLHGENALTQRQVSLKRWAAAASLSVATLLVTVKFFAYMVTDSVSLLSSLLDSGFDVAASLATLIGIARAASPADEEHRFGHGKIEALTALGQAIFICGSAFFLTFESLHRFFHPVPVQGVEMGIGVTIFSIVLTSVLIVFQRHVIAKTGSIAISADHLHYQGDLLLNLGVFAALALGYASGRTYFDPAFALLAAGILLWGARSIVRDAFDVLMDRELPEADREKILELAKKHPAVQSIHDLRTRSTGHRVFIEFHMEIDGAMTLRAAHDITEETEKLLYEAFPTAEVIIHQEPAGLDDHRMDHNIAMQRHDRK